MPRVSKAKKAARKTRLNKSRTALISVIQTVNTSDKRPAKKRRTRSSKKETSSTKRLSGGGGEGGGVGISSTLPLRAETVMKIPATMATNQQAVITSLQDAQRRQDMVGNFLMGAMLTRNQQPQQLPEARQTYPPGAIAIVEEPGDNVTSTLTLGGTKVGEIPRFNRSQFIVQEDTVRLKFDSRDRQLRKGRTSDVIIATARAAAAQFYPDKTFSPM